MKLLFVCTGNIFRSLAADYAVRHALGRSDIQVASAGTDDFPHEVRPYVREYLASKGYDVSAHRRRTLTRAILDDSTVVVAMNTDHQAHIARAYRVHVPLYTEACGEPPTPLPDIDDVFPGYVYDGTSPPHVTAHVRLTIDRIVELAPRMAGAIDYLGQTHRPRPLP